MKMDDLQLSVDGRVSATAEIEIDLDEIEDGYPLSPLQQSMLVESLSSAAGGRVGLLQLVWDLPEALDLAAFERAWTRVVERHSILRTRLVWTGCAEPFQEVVRAARLPFSTCDWTGLPPEQQEERLLAFLQEDRERGLDLGRAPLLRVLVARLHPAHHRVVLTLHHTTFDGRTLLGLIQEVFVWYAAVRHDEELALAAPLPYRAYVEWLGRQDRGRAEAFWRDALQGIREPTPLGLERRERSQGSGTGADHPPVWFYRDFSVWLSDEATESLLQLAGGLGLTLNTLLLGAWSLLLSRYSGQRDVLFGVVRTHRGAMPDGASILGPLMNSLPFRATANPEADLGSWLQALRAHWLAMRAGDFASPAEIRSWSEFDPIAPFFETLVLFETHELTERLRQQGPEWRNRSFHFFRQPRLPLSIYGYHEKRLSLKVIFDPACLDALSMQRLLEHLRTVLEAMPPGARQNVGELPWLRAAERHQLLTEWNDTAGPEGFRTAIHRRFEEHARKAPGSVAAVEPGGAGTYGEIEERANRLAWLLLERGVRPGMLVGVLLARSIPEVQTLLGVLKAGGACLPLESSAPERLDAILDDAGAALLLTHSALRPVLRFPAAQILDLDSVVEELRRQPASSPPIRIAPEQPAYVIYTSGSSGRPKGVIVPHQGLTNLIEWQLETFGISASDRVSRLAGLGFDASVLELWSGWNAGAAVVLPPDPIRSAPEALRDWMVREEITHSLVPPILTERLLELRWPVSALRFLSTGGDTLRARPPAGLPFHLFNLYGPTEGSVVTSFGGVPPASDSRWPDRPPLIGRPLQNVRMYLLDPELRPVPLGARGELVLAGSGLAQGYRARPELTAASFVPDPQGGAGERLYCTGDLARLLPDGTFEFLGRRDFQLKLRGFRIEPGEIEAVLERHPAVKGSAIVARDGVKAGDLQLVAFVIGDPEIAADDLKDFLHGKLPAYMIPALYVRLDSLPLNINGKVDRKALATQAAGIPRDAQEYVPPGTALEQLLARIWADLLGLKRVGRHDDFFALGGHSLHIMQVLSSVRELFQYEVPAERVFLSSTIAQLAEQLFPSELERLLAERVAETVLTAAADRGSEPTRTVHGRD
jgi:amino acid adenylation domain-containing protein